MNASDNTSSCVSKIDIGMDRFNKYIERGDMEKKSYQYEGVKWLLKNELRGQGEGEGEGSCGGGGYARGGFVADEMGLGKTIMMIGLCLANFMHKTLIVVPPVLIDQWFAQIYRTTGHKCVIYHGENKKLINNIGVAGLEKVVIVLCSYDAITLSRDNKKKHAINSNTHNKKHKHLESSLLHQVKWGRVIFDEAHHLRNKNTGRYVGAKLLNAEIKWLVSGTPVQNKKQDFYALCSLINLPAAYYSDSSNLMDITRNHILKRTKKQVGINLEDAVENRQIVDWKNIDELEFSKKIHSLIAFLNVKMKEKLEKGATNAREEADSTDNAVNNTIGRGLLPLLLRARQSCIYPKMVAKESSVKGTSKLDSVVGAILERKDNGNGKLVFCHFKEEMNEIYERLCNAGLHVGMLNGKTSKGARAKMLSEKRDVLIMQIQTGCEGLNLQVNYNEIYFVSPHWNPYIEDQAVARCHRIGQMKPVFVWRFEMNNFDSCDAPADAHADADSHAHVKNNNLEKYVTDIQNGKRDMVGKII